MLGLAFCGGGWGFLSFRGSFLSGGRVRGAGVFGGSWGRSGVASTFTATQRETTDRYGYHKQGEDLLHHCCLSQKSCGWFGPAEPIQAGLMTLMTPEDRQLFPRPDEIVITRDRTSLQRGVKDAPGFPKFTFWGTLAFKRQVFPGGREYRLS
jgi:hypothetical protein